MYNNICNTLYLMLMHTVSARHMLEQHIAALLALQQGVMSREQTVQDQLSRTELKQEPNKRYGAVRYSGSLLAAYKS